MVKLKIYGYPDDDVFYPIRDFLKRSVVDYDWIDLSQPRTGSVTVNLVKEQFAIQWPDGEWMADPTVEQLAQKLGWIHQPSYPTYDLTIFGAGPAGLSAAVYAASEGLKTVLVERYAIGGQAGTSSLIENYMGFPEGISGAELAERARQQAQKFGLDILLLREGVKGTFQDGKMYADLADGSKLVTRANICATGIEYRSLNLPREGAFLHKGVYYGAATSEACFCGGKDIAVVGGGNSAGQAVSYFSGFADNVYMVIRKGNLSETMSDYLMKRITNIKNVHILYYSEVLELDGDETLRKIRIHNSKDNSDKWLDISKLFICIGGSPNTDWTIGTGIIRDVNGYLVTGGELFDFPAFADTWKLKRHPYALETSVPGSFAAGDVRHSSVKRVAAAVGEGAMAVSLVHKYLAET
jgi:thioredoxin reductase (NADPH)